MLKVSRLIAVAGFVMAAGVAAGGITVVSVERRVGLSGSIAGSCTLDCADIVSTASGGFIWVRNVENCQCSTFNSQALASSSQNSSVGSNGWYGTGIQNNNFTFTSNPSQTLSSTAGTSYMTVTFTTDTLYDFTLTTQISGQNSFTYGTGSASSSMVLSDSAGELFSHTWPSADPAEKTAFIRLCPGETYTLTCNAIASATSANGGLSRATWNFAFSQFRRCKPNFNNDCALDFFDYLDFNDAYSMNDPSADYNFDSVIDFFDYLDFVADFSAGCA